MKTKKETWPKRIMGESCGADLHEDGSIEIAPSHYQAMDEVIESEEALNQLLATITQKCHELMIPISKSKKRFFDRVAEDYGLDYKKQNYSYSPYTHRLEPIKKEPGETKS